MTTLTMTGQTTTPNNITVRWPAQLLTAAKFTGHFVVALATVLFVGADH
ncbi:hypothetical protein [Kutzneria sp. CA-103260]|nr:hypothetical protein [Kutzneria sp. CA-103260]QUQ66763.1 hypothetical protein JJ691_44910 [Kutzneria sp. CA-103260]